MTAQMQHNTNRDSALSAPLSAVKGGMAAPSSAVLESHVLRALRKTLAAPESGEINSGGAVPDDVLSADLSEDRSSASTPLKTPSRHGKNAPKNAPSATALTQDAYTILGLPADADQKDIHAAFRRLALHWHPDRHEEQYQRAAERRFQAIAHAYERIKTREKRAVYDRVLADLQSLVALRQAAKNAVAQSAHRGKRIKNTASAATKDARSGAVSARNSAGFSTRLGGISNDNKGRLQAIDFRALKHQAAPQNRDAYGLKHKAGAALDVLETIFWPLRSEKAKHTASSTNSGADFGPL